MAQPALNKLIAQLKDLQAKANQHLPPADQTAYRFRYTARMLNELADIMDKLETEHGVSFGAEPLRYIHDVQSLSAEIDRVLDAAIIAGTSSSSSSRSSASSASSASADGTESTASTASSASSVSSLSSQSDISTASSPSSAVSLSSQSSRTDSDSSASSVSTDSSSSSRSSNSTSSQS